MKKFKKNKPLVQQWIEKGFDPKAAAYGFLAMSEDPVCLISSANGLGAVWSFKSERQLFDFVAFYENEDPLGIDYSRVRLCALWLDEGLLKIAVISIYEIRKSLKWINRMGILS